MDRFADNDSHSRLVATLNARYLIGVPDVKEVWLIRHADAYRADTQGIAAAESGQAADPPLSATGLAQAACLTERLAPVSFQSIWASTARRARETASVIATSVSAPVSIDARLREVRTDWEMGRPSALSAPDVYPFPEPAEQVTGRMRACLQDIVDQMPDQDGRTSRAIAVTHDVAILLTVMSLLGLAWGQFPMLMPLTSVSVVAFSGSKAIIRSIGDVTHLAELEENI